MKNELTHPQTAMESIAKNCCLAMDYCFLAALRLDNDLTEADFMRSIVDLYDKGVITDEALCWDPEKILYCLTGRHAIVTKEFDPINITSVLATDEPVIAFYSISKKEGEGHFVVMQHNKIIFNSLAHSNNVEKGTIISLRRVRWTE